MLGFPNGPTKSLVLDTLWDRPKLIIEGQQLTFYSDLSPLSTQQWRFLTTKLTNYGFPHKLLIEHKGKKIIAIKTKGQARRIADELDKDKVEIETLNSPQEDTKQRRQIYYKVIYKRCLTHYSHFAFILRSFFFLSLSLLSLYTHPYPLISPFFFHPSFSFLNMATGTTKFKLLTLNLAGLNNPIKRRKLRSLLKGKKCDEFCCHETHLRKQEEHYIREVHTGIKLRAAATVKKRGVLLGFSRATNWQEQNTVTDPEGYYLITRGLFQGIQWTIVGIYVPQTKKSVFFKSIMKELESFSIHNLVIMGDFNAVMDHTLDKVYTRPTDL